MTTSFLQLFATGCLLASIQALAAVPWVWGLDRRGLTRWLKDPMSYAYLVGAIGGTGLLLAFIMSEQRIQAKLQEYGHRYGSLLHIQLGLGFLILLPQAILVVWPKGGAVAMAAFREGWRQPMYWLVAFIAGLLMVVSMVVPYFTFGEDYKMMKQLGFDSIMLAALLFGLLATSISINDEIEGRTAITVISKPINRRQFLIGKYIGNLLACWSMMMLLGWVFTWALEIKPHFDSMDEVNDPMPRELAERLATMVDPLMPSPEGVAWAQGAARWFGETAAHHLGLLLGFGQVMTLLAICVALATRLQFVVNLVLCLFVFMIGHLAPVLVVVTQQAAQQSDAIKLIHFIAQLISAVFPGLEYFDMGPAIIRDTPLGIDEFAIYVATVLGYALIYSAIALIAGLLMFEDRDLA
jgi:ABC-type transport system involved in multi-copper enzyme maturation permease subunit